MTNKTGKRKYTKKDKDANPHIGSSLDSFIDEIKAVETNDEFSNVINANNILADCMGSAIRSVLDDEEKNMYCRLDIIKNMVNNGFKVG